MNTDRNFEPCGLWNVWTEADVEGRGSRHLGTFYGNLDDIAFALCGRKEYTLEFERVDEKSCRIVPVEHPSDKKVDVSIKNYGFPSGKERVDYFRQLLSHRSVGVSEGSAYGCVSLVFSGKSIDDVRREAIMKLSPEERRALGIKG